MNETPSAANSTSKMQPYLSPLAVWAISVGSAIGWGSLVATPEPAACTNTSKMSSAMTAPFWWPGSCS